MGNDCIDCRPCFFTDSLLHTLALAPRYTIRNFFHRRNTGSELIDKQFKTSEMENEKTPSIEVGAMENDCGPMPSSDPDDATTIAGNQQEGGQNRVSIGAVSRLTTNTTSDGSNALFTVDGSRRVPEEVKGDGKKTCCTNESKTSSFAQFVKSWETYISDPPNADTFQPMQMLQNLRLCGVGHELPRFDVGSFHRLHKLDRRTRSI